MDISAAARRSLSVLIILCAMITLPGTAAADSVRGTVVDARGTPVPSVKVQLVNRDVGVSRPRYTGRNGVFVFDNVPKVNSPYYLEIFWGSRIVHRRRLTIHGDLDLGDIRI